MLVTILQQKLSRLLFGPYQPWRNRSINQLRLLFAYCNGPKFSDGQVWANSADPDQTAPREQSDQGLHCSQFRLHLLDALLYGEAILLKF